MNMELPIQDRGFIEDTPILTPEELINCSKAVLRGIGNGLKSWAHIVRHPVDKLVYPVTDLVYDASIISATHYSNAGSPLADPDLSGFIILGRVVADNPTMYYDARDRMQRRISMAKQSLQNFADAPYDKKVEALATGLTFVYLPGGIIRGVKAAGNLAELGVVKPPGFHNLHRDGAGPRANKSTANLVPGVAAAGVRSVDPGEFLTNLRNRADGMTEVTPGGDPFYPSGYDPTLFPTSQQFELKQADVDEFTSKARAAQDAQGDLFSFLTSDPGLRKNKTLTPQTRARLLAVAEPLYEFGTLGTNLAHLALMTGGHARTWRGVSAACQSSLQLASSITSIATSQSLMSLSALTGYVGIAVGAVGLAMSLLGNDDDDGDDAVQAIMAGIAQLQIGINTIITALQEVHRTLVEGFHRIEELLVISVLARLGQINGKLDRLERITAFSFRELHLKELVDIVDVIKKEICGEHQLTDGEKRDYLRRLSTWIDCHSKSQLQTLMTRRNGDTTKMIEILGDDQDITTILPLFLNELVSLIPSLESIIAPEIAHLPNLDVFSAACDTYMLACLRPGYGATQEGVLTRAKATFNRVQTLTENLKDFRINGERLTEFLFRQYDHYRLQVGFTIVKCRKDAKDLDKSTLLGQSLKAGQLYEELMHVLNEMELRRVVLRKIVQLQAIEPNHWAIPVIESLEGKTQILAYPLSTFESYNMANEGITWISDRRASKVGVDTFVWSLPQLKRKLEMGVDPNTSDGWGQMIHYVNKYPGGLTTGTTRNHESTMLHLLLKYPGIEVGRVTGYDLGDTWGTSSNPTLHALNQAFFGLGVLLCANGLDISEVDGGAYNGFSQFHNSHLGNCYQWQASSMCAVTIRFVKDMNKADGTFNKVALRKAYKYYNLAEAGLVGSAMTDISVECVLLLTCII